MWIEVLEPIRDLFKYQVRILGKALGVPASLLNRQPFPGPGLSVRVGGMVDREKVGVIRGITSEVEDFLEPYDPAQYLAYLIDLEVKREHLAEDIAHDYLGGDYQIEANVHEAVAVGVKGDERVLGKVLSLDVERNREPAWNEIRWLDILRMQSAITGRLRDVCRIVALIGSGVDGIIGVVVRAVDTRDFMTAMPTQIPFDNLSTLGGKIVEHPLVGNAFYEITTKPSSTIELE
jgi:GMP synthase (glutamine-hydrolysing)